MNVYLLLIDGERFFFYSAENEGEETAEVNHLENKAPSKTRWYSSWISNLTASLSKRLNRLKDVWEHAENGMLGKVHRYWDWLHTFIHPQESMLVRLYWAKRIDLFYPASRSSEIRTIWRSYLRGRFWHHLLWFGINTAIVPAVTILAVLPGPNLIGYWFTYRAIHHGLIVLGIRRARRETVPTSLVPSAALDLPVHRDLDGKAAHPIFRETRHHDRLHDYYEWAGGQSSSLPLAPSPAQPNDSADPGDE